MRNAEISAEDLLRNDFEGIVDLLQNRLAENFGCSDDEAVRMLHVNMYELKHCRHIHASLYCDGTPVILDA